MIRSEILERFILGYGLEVPDEGLGRPVSFSQLWKAARENCGECSADELLDALFNLEREHAELNKFYLVGNQYLPSSFESRRPKSNWKEFFYGDSFRIRVLPPGRRRFEKLGEGNGSDDRRFARLAIEEARKSVAQSDGRVHPNVGAVVVKNGVELSKAHRGERPENHAEYIALEKKLADEAVAGATVYTTLEPCTTRNHPKIPCAQRLIERRVTRVVMGMLDPDKRITGRGQRKLRDAGIATDFFPPDLMSEVEELNREFTRHCEQKGEEVAGGPDLSLEWKHAKNSGDLICLRNIGNTSAFNIGLKFSWEELFFDPPFDRNVLHPSQEITQHAHFGERTGPHSVNLGWMEEILRIAYLNDRKPPLQVILSFSDGQARFEKPFTFELGPGGRNAERIKITPGLRKKIQAATSNLAES